MAQMTNDFTLAGLSGVERYRPTVAPHPNRAVATGVLVAGLLCTILVLARQKPPEMVVASVSPTEFSLNNALGHLKNIAAKPHPLGSTADAEVREYLLQALTAEGLTPQVQRLDLMGQTSDAPVVVRNVVARLKGTNNSKAVLLIAHHDTVVDSPGAGDNGSSVVALLETLRALKAGPPLKNDVIFLFTDGEECGLLGAHAFVSQHEWSKDVGLVLNFDARGNRGPVLMFETGENNGWLTKEFARAAPHPFTSSLFPELYRLLPNNTDFTVFKNAGLQGLNFAFIDGHAFYHQSTDTIKNLDLRSLDHLGSSALSLTRHFGNQNLTATASGGNAIYFDLLGAMVASYPRTWAGPLALLAGALFVVVVVFALKKKQLKVSGILGGSSAFLVSLLAVPLAITVLAVILLRFFPDLARPSQHATTRYLYLAGALTIAIGAVVYRSFRNRMSVEEATLGGLLWWFAGMILTSVFMPGGSYLFTWPLLLMSLAHGALFVSSRSGSRAVYLFLLAAGMLLGIILFVPFIFHTSIAVNVSLYGLPMCMLVFVVSLFLPLFSSLSMSIRPYSSIKQALRQES
jgi:Peptidase family M28